MIEPGPGITHSKKTFFPHLWKIHTEGVQTSNFILPYYDETKPFTECENNISVQRNALAYSPRRFITTAALF